ncbi:MAG: PIG-L family deacetylase [Gemmatimonadota bacterium]|nr:PIG-L family deacetylase [Gemmatimonadota bacterium]
MQGKVVAAIFAHPDDESFSIGGTIARYAKLGVRWHLFCATDGDAGRTSAVPVASRAELGALRRNELIAAARLLGVRGQIVARGYPDGALAQVEADRLVGDVVAFLRDVKPDLVITFGPEGAPNAHRDHRAISRAATAAFHLAASPTAYADQQQSAHAAARLYYVTWPPPGVGSPYTVYGVPATARIDIRRELETKRRAFLLHATQRELMDRFELLALTDEESYALAGGRPQPRETIDDLFDGL